VPNGEAALIGNQELDFALPGECGLEEYGDPGPLAPLSGFRVRCPTAPVHDGGRCFRTGRRKGSTSLDGTREGRSTYLMNRNLRESTAP